MRFLAVILALALVSAGLFSLLQPVAVADGPARRASLDDDIGKHMSAVNRAMRKVKRYLADEANNAKSLENVVIAQREFLAVKVLVPDKVEKLDAREKTKQTAVFRKMCIQVVEHMLALERALIDGDMDAAKAAYRKVMSLEEKGHALFSE